MVATFFFVFVAVGTAIGATQNYPMSRGIVIAVGFGMSIFVLIHCFGHISGGNINPAVTIALLLAKQIEWVQCLFYVAAQILGSIFASGLLLIVFDDDILGGYNTILVSSKTGEKNIGAAFIVELITTMLLLFSVFATIDPRRNSATDLGPLAIGGAVTICHLIGVPVTGCGINPARSIGPAILAPKLAGTTCGCSLSRRSARAPWSQSRTHTSLPRRRFKSADFEQGSSRRVLRPTASWQCKICHVRSVSTIR
mmetsp:Transcript_5757/g.14337  ORF Transcript_5757/g.14337 Transcript_5757/m.14337 type:complete len:254 (-) Transcript_5757:56-817(-)